MSSYVAVHESHRRALRRTGIYSLLLHQLTSPSLTVVSNACGTLWNLSARCAEDQQVGWSTALSTIPAAETFSVLNFIKSISLSA